LAWPLRWLRRRANAQVDVTFEQGFWALSTGTAVDGESVCVADTVGTDKGADWSFSLRFFGTSQTIQVWFFKETWSIPSDVTTGVELEFDSMGEWVLETYAHEDGDVLWSYVPNGNDDLFLEELTKAKSATIAFDGNEPPWELDMRGSAAVAGRFLDCIEDLRTNAPEPSQPFDEPSQPFEEPATQEETQPFVKTKPGKPADAV
jgi:hypothetical protein